MEFLDGKNLEELLETDIANREKYINIIKNIFQEFLKNNIIIFDFAPRNIIYSEKTGKITLVDFERGFIKTNGFNNDEIIFCLSFSIFEEFSAFLTNKEIKEIFGDMKILDFKNINNNLLEKINIGTRRKKLVEEIKSNSNNFSKSREIILYFFINKFIGYFINQNSNPKMIYKIDYFSFEEYKTEILNFIYNNIYEK